MRGVVFFLCLFAFGNAAKNNNFCNSHMKQNADPHGVMATPTIPTDFTIVIEQTKEGQKMILYTEMDYSTILNKMHIKVTGGINTTEVFFDPSRDIDLETSSRRGSSDDLCEYFPLEKSSTAKFLGFKKNVQGVTQMVPPQEALRFIMPGTKPIYVGKGMARGIPTNQWQVCQYLSDSDSTAAVTFDFAQPIVKTPDFKDTILAANIVGVSTQADPGSTFTYRYDYFNMQQLLISQSNRFVPPPLVFCSDAPISNNIPIMPQTFSFKAEQTELKYSPDGSNTLIEQRMKFYMEQYMGYANMVVLDVMATAAPGTDYVDYNRVVHDFTLGISYRIDYIVGNCNISQIPADGVDAYQSSHNNIKMKNAQDFLMLNKNYVYIGRIWHTTRSIDCDQWVSFDLEGMNSAMTLVYFAAKEWMIKKMGFGVYQPLPVQIKEWNLVSRTSFSIFEYATEPYDPNPDYSMCFDQSDSKKIEILFTGANFYDVYPMNANNFVIGLYQAICTAGSFSASTRITEIDVHPGQNSRVVDVHFKLLGRPKVKDGVNLPSFYPSVQTIYNNLQNQVKSGKLSFLVMNNNGAIVGKLTASKMGTFSVFESASFGYSAGSMAGIGLGLLIVGLLLSAVAVFILFKLRGGGTSDIGLTRLGGNAGS